MSLVEFAKSELARITADDDEIQQAISEDVLEIVKKFADQGHSGSSAAYSLHIIERLLRFEPITPLTGEDDEWNEVGDGVFQNRRCPRVFKENGVAYDIDGIVWLDPDGGGFTNGDSRVVIEFPYTPKTEYLEAPVEERLL